MEDSSDAGVNEYWKDLKNEEKDNQSHSGIDFKSLFGLSAPLFLRSPNNSSKIMNDKRVGDLCKTYYEHKEL